MNDSQLKYYLIGLIDYFAIVLVFVKELNEYVQLIASICAVIATIYLIIKYHRDTSLSKSQKLKEERQIKLLELQIEEEEAKKDKLKSDGTYN